MCGIIGYSGHNPAVSLVVEGLRRLEYRGYDSAGVAFLRNGCLEVVRAEGKLKELEAKLACQEFGRELGQESGQSTMAIGHTRWATHGLPVEKNAHPHTDNCNSLALVHNGIIENYREIREELKAKGHVFHSDTDTEAMAHLIAEGLKDNDDILKAISQALARLEGSFAVAVVCLDQPGAVFGARQACPLVLGVGENEHFIASDIPAFLDHTRDVVFLEDGEIVRITPDSWEVFEATSLRPLDKDVQRITWDVQAAQKGGYKHFMLKEIFEQPEVVADCLVGRLDNDRQEAFLPELEGFAVPERLHIVACGTSYHAGLFGMHLMESWARLPTRVEIASEFRYRDVILGPGDAVLVISQSGETADTLAGLRLAKKMGAPVLGLCNVVGSSVAREADRVLYTQAGPEISVASTKAMCSQLALLTLLALCWGRQRGALDENVGEAAVKTLTTLPGMLESALPAMRDTAKALARSYCEARSFLYLGRGPYHPLAMEGALKLKEISYIHAEGFAAGEMKHGPIALIDPRFPSFAVALDDPLFPKVKSNIEEVQARGGKVVALTHPDVELNVDDKWVIPKVWGPLNAFMVLPALQLFAYEMAEYLGKDVDQPRNLAKSVTVE